MGDWGLATEAVEEEPSLLLAREFAALGSHQSGYSLTLDSYSDSDLNVQINIKIRLQPALLSLSGVRHKHILVKS